jgi:hypothetical protein
MRGPSTSLGLRRVLGRQLGLSVRAGSHRALLLAFAEAEALLVVNPLAERDLSADQAEALLLDSVFSADPFGPL